MNVLVLGSGGREHAFAWKLRQSNRLGQLYIAPGNAGTKALGTNLDLDFSSPEEVVTAVQQHAIDLILIGPEVPLVAGLVDDLAIALPTVKVVGPHRSGALLEGSKSFAKDFMQRHKIPTAAYREFERNDIEAGLAYLRGHALPIVLKADGLAAGKGVIICTDRNEAIEEFQAMLSGKFGAASDKVVVEEFLTGLEFSVFVAVDGESHLLLPMAKDYKRIGEGDTGLNTGGMGSVSPVPFVDDLMRRKVIEQVVIPSVQGINKDGLDYKGFLFVGLIEVDGEPYVIEYNCRMGDPETQSVMPRLKSDFLELCLAICDGRLDQYRIDVDEQSAASIVMVSGGYPEAYEKGKQIKGLAEVHGSTVFHAGTKELNGEIVTNGGRVLAVTSLGSSLGEALASSYENVDRLDFAENYCRRDIGFDL